MNYTDAEILSAIKNGESGKVLNFLYKTVRPKIKAWVVQNNGDDDEAQDIFQDAIIVFHKYVVMDQFKKENSVAGFIYSISKNMWINRIKQKNKFNGNIESQLKTHSEENEFYVQTLNDERADKIQEILSQLGERCKELLTYSIFYRLPMEEISEKMGFSNANTAKTKNYKCKQRLIKLVKENAHLKEFLYG